MNVKNLPLKFALLALVVTVALLSIKFKGLKEGIDLRGGTSLIYEIRTPAAENAVFETQRAQLEAKLPATSGEERQRTEQSIKALNEQIEENRRSQSQSVNLAEDIIGILKERVDPYGLYSLEWRPLGTSRIEIRMPAGQEESRKAKEAYNRALDETQEKNISRSQLRRLEQAPAQDRNALIQQMTNDPVQAQNLAELAAAFDRMNQAQKAIEPLRQQVASAESATTQATQPAADPKVQTARDALKNAQNALMDAEITYQSARRAIEEANINIQEVQTTLKSYVSPEEANALRKNNSSELKRRQIVYTEGKSSLLEKYQGRQAEIDKIIASYENWASKRKRLDDPTDLQRMIRKSGVLEFRMAPRVAGGGGFQLSPTDQDRYEQQLQREGPDGGRKRNEPYQWFALKGDREGYDALVVGEHNGQLYMLLSNSPNNTMLNPPGANRWQLSDAFVGGDDMGRPAVDFVFDERGAKLFSRLTSTNIGNQMAVMLDDEIYSAPVINSTISQRGQITGNFSLPEVQELVRTFKAGSLPAKLNADPVSVSSFGSALGEINKKLSIRAGIIALIAVAGFMMMYYLLSGAIANFALMLNLILIIGAMSLLNAVFTMPGIAGLILTIGMAVDANVLINERLREEQDRGLPIRLALKNAYERAFSAIFDSNLTTLITCAILFWLGTEEIRGFAITLALGVIFNLFTAVYFTRWVFQVLLAVKAIKSHQYMLRLIHVPKINWVSKRYYFWAVSVVIIVVGMIALYTQGGKIWGIEFAAGTQATLVFKAETTLQDKGKAVLPNDRLVSDEFRSAASKLAEADTAGVDFSRVRDNIRIETVLDPDKVVKFMRAHDPDYNSSVSDNKITLEEWKSRGGSEAYFAMVDGNKNSLLEQDELAKTLPSTAYKVNTSETRLDVIRQVASEAFGSTLANRQKLSYQIVTGSDEAGRQVAKTLGVALAADGKTQIKPGARNTATVEYRDEFEDFEGGLLLVVKNIQPAVTKTELEQRLDDMRLQPDEALASTAANPVDFVGLEVADAQAHTYKSFAILARPAEMAMAADRDAWIQFAGNQTQLVQEVLEREESMTAVNYDPQIASQTKQRGIMALTLSWIAIIMYLWLRFGSATWGLAAVICLVHDAVIVLGVVAMSSWLSATAFGQSLMISPFKIDLAMVAALLTVIGYSVNDTIVIFDRIRENRGKLSTVSPQIINLSINQTLSRTILTSFTLMIVVVVMYAQAGESIRGFNYALMVGMLFGVYSTIALAAPMLLGFKKMVMLKAASLSMTADSTPPASTPTAGPKR